MLGAIKYQLANLFNFHGRDARQTFWYWVLAVYIASFAINTAVTMPLMMKSMFSAVRTASTMDDPQAAQEVVNHAMAGSFAPMIWVSVALSLAMVLLLAASLVRRLHDSGLSGRWALLPAALQLGALAAMPAQMARMTQVLSAGPNAATVAGNPMGFMQGQLGLSALAWVAIILVIVLGVRRSEPGPNRFGDDSVRF